MFRRLIPTSALAVALIFPALAQPPAPPPMPRPDSGATPAPQVRQFAPPANEPRETPPDPYAGDFPAEAYQDQEAFLRAMQRRIESMVQTSVNREIERLRRENIAMETRLRRLSTEASAAVEKALEGGVEQQSLEARIARTFRREARNRFEAELGPLFQDLTPEEIALFRTALTDYFASLSPLDHYQIMRLERGEGRLVAILSLPWADSSETRAAGLRSALGALGFTFDESREEKFNAALASWFSRMDTMRLERL